MHCNHCILLRERGGVNFRVFCLVSSWISWGIFMLGNRIWSEALLVDGCKYWVSLDYSHYRSRILDSLVCACMICMYCHSCKRCNCGEANNIILADKQCHWVLTSLPAWPRHQLLVAYPLSHGTIKFHVSPVPFNHDPEKNSIYYFNVCMTNNTCNHCIYCI